MDNPFNLTKCKTLTKRRKTIAKGEPTTFYYTYYEPKGLDKQGRRYAIDHFKHPETGEDRQTSDEMINYAVEEFLKVHTINDFETILGVPSSSKIIKKIIDAFIQHGFSGTVIYKAFEKTRIRNVKLNQSMLDREPSLKTKEKVPKSFERTRKLHYDKVAKASLYPTRFRRYLTNLLVPTPHWGFKVSNVKQQKVLVVDDTFGEGLTMTEVYKILQPYTSEIIGFTVMKDQYANKKTKKNECQTINSSSPKNSP